LSRNRQLATALGVEAEDLLQEAAEKIMVALKQVVTATDEGGRCAGFASLIEKSPAR